MASRTLGGVDELASLATHLRERLRGEGRQGPPVVALSGIDASGKGFLATRLRQALLAQGLNAALVGIDPWLSSPAARPAATTEGERFYLYAFDFDRLFTRLIDPLRRQGSVDVVETLFGLDGVGREQRITFRDADIVLVEGIFLFRRELVSRFDLRVWVDCSFRTALERAVRRNQEGLPPESLLRDYHTIYFPAQELHFHRDQPRAAADVRLVNDDACLSDPALAAGA